MKQLFVTFIFLFVCTGLLAQNITREEVVFKSGEHVLEGTLALPASAQNVPVVIFLGGINEYGELHQQYESFVRENLEAVFVPSGVAVFYFNPRGVGGSDGRWRRATFEDFRDDALAAIQFIKQRREVNPNRIGFLGHGEYGYIAQMIGAQSAKQVQFIATLATPTFTPEKQLINQYYNEYLCNEEDSSSARQKAEQKASSHQNWVSVLPLTRRWRHMKMKQGFEPDQYISGITSPALFIFAENDPKLSPEWAMDELDIIFSGEIPKHISTYTINGANHYFHVTGPCFEYDRDDPRLLELNFSFRFREVLRDWVFRHL